MFGSAPQGHFLRGASQGGEQADQLYFGMLGSLIAFLWSADEYLRKNTMALFGKPEDAITSKIIFHASTLGIPERQQLGKASLSANGFQMHIPKTSIGDQVSLHVPLTNIDKLRAFQKKTYSSVFYVIQVDYQNSNSKPAMVSCEIRVFLRRGQALMAVKRWKEVYNRLCSLNHFGVSRQ